MNQDPINQNYNPQTVPNQYNPTGVSDINQNLNGNSFANNTSTNAYPNNQTHFSPSTVDLDSLNSKSQLDNLLHQTHQQPQNNFQPQDYNGQQYQQNDQFGGYNPYQNTGSNIQNFAPQDNFDTGFNPEFNPNPEFNQNGIDQYKSSTPQFNPNDPYLMPSTNPELDDIDDGQEEAIEKPQKDTKKILMFGLIGLIVLLLVASLALFFLNQNKNQPNPSVVSPTSSKPTVQGLPNNSETNSTKSSTLEKNIDTASKTGNPASPASKSISNPDAVTVTADWLSTNFSLAKGALAEDGTCKLQNVCGLKSDPDKDGLNNLDEYIYGTDPTNNDIDIDGISDKDELYVYFTDPKNPDTNGNGFKDGSELINCYDPNISSQKLTKARLNEISSNVNKPFVNGLSIPTSNTLKEANAKAGELEKGYLTKCAITTPQEDVMTKSTQPQDKPVTKPAIKPTVKPIEPQDTNTNEGS
jgi:flagellar basal body-associated protein FliL